uniref:Uncharacterized protein n=1 Tax=Peronospora matthiolae TaxID=2874970 RepID=A0AAV1VAX9_9STRA
MNERERAIELRLDRVRAGKCRHLAEAQSEPVGRVWQNPRVRRGLSK